jgi:hypothetical protein
MGPVCWSILRRVTGGLRLKLPPSYPPATIGLNGFLQCREAAALQRLIARELKPA